MYEIADPYLTFWFAVLREDADLVEGGQGAAVQQRASGRWQSHVGRVFEEAAREHAVRMVSAGELAPAMTVGRWWRDEVVEVDVLGLLDGRTRLLREARWQADPVDHRDLRALTRKLDYLPEPHEDLELALWSRGGAGPISPRNPASGCSLRPTCSSSAADML